MAPASQAHCLAQLSLGCPTATLALGDLVTSPRGSSLGPIPSPARENPSPGSHGAVDGCATLPQGLQQDLGAAEELAEHHLPSQKVGQAAEPLCPRAWGHHASEQRALAGAEEPSLEKQRAHGAAERHCARLVSP